MTRPRALGAYIFAGGFTLGVREHFDVVAHLENEQAYGAATAQRNFPGLSVHRGFAGWPVEEMRALDIPFVYGNPPCAAWSLAGAMPGKSKSETWRDDPRVSCTTEHFSLLERLRPRVWVWESVTQAFITGREFVDDLARRGMEMGYSATVYLHDAQWLGVPHRRKRFMLILHDVELDLPAPTWESETVSEALRRINDIGEVHGSAATYQRSYGWLLPHARGTTDLAKTFNEVMGDDPPRNERGNVKGRPSFLLRRDMPDRVAATIMHERVHPTEDRFMTLKELAHLCGFPTNYELNYGDMHELSRGVMPPVGEHVAARVAAAIRADVRVTAPAYRLVDHLKPPGHTAPLTLGGPRPQSQLAARPAPVATTTAEPIQAGVRAGDVRPKPGVGSGAYMRLLLTMGYDTAQILEMNLRHFPSSKATNADVSWNRKKLAELQRAAGTAIVQPVAPAVPTTQATRKHVSRERDGREYDTSALTEKSHGYKVHRDYAAHFFRWGFVRRMIGLNPGPVLEVGCGEDFPFVKHISYGDQVPERYVGVDLNPLPHPPTQKWATVHGGFDFNARHAELGAGAYESVICLEVIEHMTRAHGDELLAGIRHCLAPAGKVYLSTPVFDGKAATNHIHEYEIPELREAVEVAGFRVVRRFGTFANQRDIMRVATPEQAATLTAINEYYTTDVTACFLAPLYPDASRNNLWVIEHADG